MSKGLRLLLLIIGIAIVNVIAFSPGLLGITFNRENALQTAFGAALLLGSILALLYGLYGLLFHSESVTPVTKLETHEDYMKALRSYGNVRALKKDLSFAAAQEGRLRKKKVTLIHALKQRFDTSELSYQKFTSVILEVENLFYLNIRNILNKISVFDESEYHSVMSPDSSRFTGALLQEKKELYNEYTSYIKNAITINEEILLDLDKLLVEITNLSSVDIQDIDSMPCMKEIETLIQQTKLYKL